MAKKPKQSVVLQVDLTDYGWTLTEDGRSQGLFVSKDKAISRLKERQRALRPMAEPQTLSSPVKKIRLAVAKANGARVVWRDILRRADLIK
jgi:hypothetical protein